VIKKLTSLNETIVKERENILRLNSRHEQKIKAAKLKIEDGEKGIVFLKEQTKVNAAQIAQIQAIVKPSLSIKKKD
jgi:hypothetical protein